MLTYLAMLAVLALLPLFILALLIFFLSWELPSLKVVYRTLFRDLWGMTVWIRFQFFMKKYHWQNANIGKLFQDQVKRTPNKVCFLFEDQKWTFQQVEDYSNQVANAFAAAGYRKKDEVALFMENRPEFVCIWLGLSKIGVIPALINTNLKKESLAHSVNVVNTKSIIFNAALAPAVKDAFPYLNQKSNIDYFCLDSVNKNDGSVQFSSLDFFLQDALKNPPDDSKHNVNFTDILFYIYTSGTTGLPKAAIIRHSRYIRYGIAIKLGFKLKNDDIVYNTLPLYHTSGASMVLCGVLIHGGTMIIRKKFSASNFWKDAVKYKATVGQYIGETCRYLIAQPKSEEETKHTIRVFIGNGLRPQIWKAFQSRFRIPQIFEVYGSTEGNAVLVNIFGKPGYIGIMTRLFPVIYPLSLIKMNSESSEPIRNEAGLCIRCKPGEPGALVGKITRKDPATYFDGYVNKSETKKKIIRNCFSKGDEVFFTGDMMIMNEDGYVCFLDRIGDTFRWKGENVSTAEVEGIISKTLNFLTCVVYGVEIPGTEGRAGMVAIERDSDVVLDGLYKRLTPSLASYAIPIFIRTCKEIDLTGTYKIMKVGLRKEGFNPTVISDPIFILDSKTSSYVRLDAEGYKRVINGELRF